MSILAQYGTIKFYESKEYVHHEITHNENVMALFQNNKIPAIQLFIDDESVTTLNISLIRYSDDQVIHIEGVLVENETNGKRFKFAGKTLESTNEDGWYYVKLSSGAIAYYSDVFMWKTSTAELTESIKINVDTSDFAIGRQQEYIFDTTDFEYECYLLIDQYDGIELQNEEDANEENGQIIPYYTGFARMRQFVIKGHESIYEFMVGLRVMKINGVVTISYRGISYVANDISVEVNNKSGDFDIVFITLKFVANNDIITPINDI